MAKLDAALNRWVGAEAAPTDEGGEPAPRVDEPAVDAATLEALRALADDD